VRASWGLPEFKGADAQVRAGACARFGVCGEAWSRPAHTRARLRGHHGAWTLNRTDDDGIKPSTRPKARRKVRCSAGATGRMADEAPQNTVPRGSPTRARGIVQR
jgi:hypothetical protein